MSITSNSDMEKTLGTAMQEIEQEIARLTVVHAALREAGFVPTVAAGEGAQTKATALTVTRRRRTPKAIGRYSSYAPTQYLKAWLATQDGTLTFTTGVAEKAIRHLGWRVNPRNSGAPTQLVYQALNNMRKAPEPRVARVATGTWQATPAARA